MKKQKVTVTVLEGPNEGAHAEFDNGEIRIGRARCDLTLNDKKVSSTHCRVYLDPSGIVWLEDLKSTNGTFIGSHRISKPERLENLDDFIVGLSRLSVAIVETLDSAIPEIDPSLSFSRTEQMKPTIKVVDPLFNDEALDENAAYRETGIHRIENLIEDEMATLSKWDGNAGKASGGGDKAPPSIRVILKRVKGPESLNEYICSQTVTTMGRKNVDVKLNDLDCSRVHAQIEIYGRKAFVKDAGSTNGTLLNGRRITSEEISNGDIIQIGQTVFEVVIEGGR